MRGSNANLKGIGLTRPCYALLLSASSASGTRVLEIRPAESTNSLNGFSGAP
jgi:hypothetical protein